jgi:Phage integrase family
MDSWLQSLSWKNKQKLYHTALVHEAVYRKDSHTKEIGEMARTLLQAFRLSTQPEEPLCALKMREGAVTRGGGEQFHTSAIMATIMKLRQCQPRVMQTYGEQAGIPPDKQKFHCLRHSIATHLLDAGADLAFVKDWLEHATIQNTTISARLTTATLDAQARTIFASHRVVECLLVSEERGGTLSWHASLCPTLATLHPVADKASRTDAEHQQDIGTWLRHAEALGVLRVRVATGSAWLTGVLRALCVTHGRREQHQSHSAHAGADHSSY